MKKELRILVLCTLEAGLDAVSEVLRQGGSIAGIVGLRPESVKPEVVSGWTDVADFCQRWKLPVHFVERYDLKSTADQALFARLEFDLVWVAGWQRLVPAWLLERARLGALGAHGSADGIVGGRGRSPQNWALMLGCRQFDLALFRITPGVDDGPIIARRSFLINDSDDICSSYKKSSLATAQMVLEVLAQPDLLERALPQRGEASYYPQRLPADGFVDWHLGQDEIVAHCRALTRPYPGLRCTADSSEITLWRCRVFDDDAGAAPGSIGPVFSDGSFLVTCGDGRLLVDEWTCQDGWQPQPGVQLQGKEFAVVLEDIVQRHRKRYPNAPVAARVINRLASGTRERS